MILGIDPGLSGGLVLISSDKKHPVILLKEIMPVIGGDLDNKKLIDIYNFCMGMSDNELVIALEQVSAMPGQGVSSMFKFGAVFGALRALCDFSGVKYHLIRPQKWQKLVHEGVKKDLKPKDKAVISAKRIFPNEKFLASERCKVAHSGLVDACLIAYAQLLLM